MTKQHLCSYAKELTPQGRRRGTVKVYDMADVPHAMQQKYFMWTHYGWLRWKVAQAEKEGRPLYEIL